MIIYNKENGLIISQIPDDQNIDIFYKYYPEEFKKNIAILNDELEKYELNKYKVEGGKLILLNPNELIEISNYDRLLTNEERLKLKLKNRLLPSKSEIDRSETIIDILELMSEVLK